MYKLATADELVILVEQLQRQAAEESDVDGPKELLSKAGMPGNRGLVHVLSNEEQRLVVKPAVDRFNKQYRSQYKSEFVTVE